jgi:tRNA(Ile)-lysidine synthase
VHVAQVRPKAQGGNAEATARRRRYRALARIARAQGCACIATGHHAHDQVETVLMALLRGAGPRGLAGMAPSRAVPGAPDLRLIRPCLGLVRQDLQALCARCRWRWQEDATNADATRLRSALRTSVVPALLALRPAMVGGLADRAALLRSGARVIDRASARLLTRSTLAKGKSEVVLNKRALVGRPLALVAGALRLALQGLGVTGQRLGHRQLLPLARAARMPAKGQQWPKSFAIRGADARVTALEVRLRATPP